MLIAAEVPKLNGDEEVPTVVAKVELVDTSSPAAGVTVTWVPFSAAPVTVKLAAEEAVPYVVVNALANVAGATPKVGTAGASGVA
jgi:hypothetical protein